jgi:hypothetical protein
MRRLLFILSTWTLQRPIAVKPGRGSPVPHSTAAVGRGNGPKEQSSRKMTRYWVIGASSRAAQVASVDAAASRLKTDEMRAVIHTAVVGGVGGCRAGKGATEGRSDEQQAGGEGSPNSIRARSGIDRLQFVNSQTARSWTNLPQEAVSPSCGRWRRPL